MPVAETPQHMQALAKANRIHVEAARQRRALLGAPAAVLIPALIDPTPELASYKLGKLFVSANCGLIRRFGLATLRRAMADIERPRGRQWHTEIRLRDLTRDERVRLASAVLRRAPEDWREAEGAGR